VAAVLQVDDGRHCRHVRLDLALDRPRADVPEDQRGAAVVAARRQEDVAVEVAEGGQAADGGLVALQPAHLAPLEGIDVDGGVLGAGGDVLVVEEVDAEDGVAVVRLHLLQAVQPHLIAPLHQAPLLVAVHPQPPLPALRLPLLLPPHLLVARIAGEVHVEGLHHRGLVELPQDLLGVLHLLALPLDQQLRRDHVLVEVVEDLLDEGAEVLLDLLELGRQLLVAVEAALRRPDHDQFVGEAEDGLQLLLLEFAQVAVDLEVAHVLGISLDLVDQVLVGNGGVEAHAVGEARLVVHQDLLPEQPQLLHFALDLGVLGDVGLVDEVELGLHGYLDVLHDVVDFSAEDGEVVLDPALLPLDLLLEHVDVLLLVAEQEHQLVGEDVGVLRHQVAQLRHVAARHRHLRTRHVLPRAHRPVSLLLRRQTPVAFIKVVGWQVVEHGRMGGLRS
jgi:hypothetical protein